MKTFDDHGNVLIDEISAPGLENCNVHQYQYDSKGNIIKEVLNKGEEITIYKYDKKGRLSKTISRGNANCHYYYDEHDNVCRIIEGAIDIIIENDERGNELHHCIRSVGEEGLKIEFEYWQEFDSNNNMIYSKNDELESWFSYDNNNNLIYEKNVYSENSDEEDNEIFYEYNDSNELIKKYMTDMGEIFYEYSYYEA
jgi:YD repeat-containing protein